MALKFASIYWCFNDQFHFEELKSSFESRGYHLRDAPENMLNLVGDTECEQTDRKFVNKEKMEILLCGPPTEEDIVDALKRGYNIEYYWWTQQVGGQMLMDLPSHILRKDSDLIEELYVLASFQRPYLQQAVRAIEERFLWLANRGVAELLIADLVGMTEAYDWDALAMGTNKEYEGIARYGLFYPNILGFRKGKGEYLVEYFRDIPGWDYEAHGDYVILKGASIDQHPDPRDFREALEERRRRKFWE